MQPALCLLLAKAGYSTYVTLWGYLLTDQLQFEFVTFCKSSASSYPKGGKHIVCYFPSVLCVCQDESLKGDVLPQATFTV
jgi:hypothetical protein